MTDLRTRNNVLPRLNAREVRDHHPTVPFSFNGDDMGLATDYALATLELPPGTVFYEDPDVTDPFAFPAQVAGRKTYVVVCREREDIEWPAWLMRQRVLARGDLARIIRERMGDVLAWLDAAKDGADDE